MPRLEKAGLETTLETALESCTYETPECYATSEKISPNGVI
jgi:hypothetical protein